MTRCSCGSKGLLAWVERASADDTKKLRIYEKQERKREGLAEVDAANAAKQKSRFTCIPRSRG